MFLPASLTAAREITFSSVTVFFDPKMSKNVPILNQKDPTDFVALSQKLFKNETEKHFFGRNFRAFLNRKVPIDFVTLN